MSGRISGTNQPTEADFWRVIRRLGWSEPEMARLREVMATRGCGWPWLITIMEQVRFGTTAAGPVLAWLAGLDRFQVEVLSYFDDPLDTNRWRACSATATDAHAVQAEMVANARMSNVVKSWWLALGEDAGYGYTARLTIPEAITLRDRGQMDTIRVLAALRMQSERI